MSNWLFLLEAGATTSSVGGSTYYLIIWGAFILFMWFFLIRPQRKKQKEMAKMQREIGVGQSVLTSGGLYGKVVDTVNDILIVEFGINKGVRVPVQRSTVMSVAEPDLSLAKAEKTE